MSEEKTPYVLAGQQPHKIVERRLLAPFQGALLLENGSLALMDSQSGAQITLDVAASYELLDLLSKHRDELYQLVQHSSQAEPKVRMQYNPQSDCYEAMLNGRGYAVQRRVYETFLLGSPGNREDVQWWIDNMPGFETEDVKPKKRKEGRTHDRRTTTNRRRAIRVC